MSDIRVKIQLVRDRVLPRLIILSFSYFLGGGSLFAIHNECEVYNPRSDRWASLCPMTSRRSRAGVTSLGKLLYVVGG